MNDIDLYERVLGLDEPWFVQRVELSVNPQRVDIWVEHRPGVKWACPHCGKELATHDHVAERTWRHLDTCQFQTHLHARIPRVKCQEHGVVQTRVPWAEPHGRFTMLFERWIIDVLKATKTISGACMLLGVSWDEAFGVMDRAVDRGLARKKPRPVKYVGVDEKAFRKGQSYVTVVCDIERGTADHVADGRTSESLEEYYELLTEKQLAAIEGVAMDMWEPYVKATVENVPLAKEKIVFDRFHVMKQMNEAVDQVRRAEHRKLKAEGDETLTGTRHLWLYGRENLPEQSQPRFKEVRDLELKTSRAWAIKETLRGLWEYRSITWARKFFNQWFGWARRSKLAPVKKVALTIKRHLENILTYCRHPISNGVAEGLNSKIMAIKRLACGYRNNDNFKTAILFFCGGLEMYPQ